MQKVYLGLGSNKEYKGMLPWQVLDAACARLENLLVDFKVSSLYRTKAMYVTDQSDFYNMVAYGLVDDKENPYEFLKKINSIEADFGRDRSKEIRFGPRSLDIDIEIFGDSVIRSEILEIPHPRIKERAFVLFPLVEVLEKNADNLLDEYLEYLKTVDASGIQKIK